MGEFSIEGEEKAEASIENICQRFGAQLTEREIKILEYKYDHKMPFWKIGEAVGLSGWGAKLVMRKAIGKIKEEMRVAA